MNQCLRKWKKPLKKKATPYRHSLGNFLKAGKNQNKQATREAGFFVVKSDKKPVFRVSKVTKSKKAQCLNVYSDILNKGGIL